MAPLTSNIRRVVLLHGLGRSRASMLPMALWLRRAGFRCYRVGYPSTDMPVAESIAHVRQSLGIMAQPCHLVGHSLGGIIAAALLRTPEGLEIGRVVQLGSPNRGSPLAEELGARWPVNTICGPALEDLREDHGWIEPHPQIGAIGGTLGPPGLPLSDPHDGAVTLRSAWCGAGHRIAVPVVHTTLPISFKAARLTEAFLKTGRFPYQPSALVR